MKFLSIVSDFGMKDGAAASINTTIWKEYEEVKIIEISHQINPFDLYEAAFVLQNSLNSFPENSIHLLCVGSIIHPHESTICMQKENQYFIANDNGVLSLIWPEIKPSAIYQINFKQENSTNIVQDVYCKVALHLLKGGSLSVIGKPTQELKKYTAMQPTSKENQITGFIVYVDNYGNAISNINLSLFQKVGKNRRFEIFARNYSFTTLQKNYSDVVSNFDNEAHFHGQNMALFNSNAYLEIAMYKSNHNSVGGASQLLGLKKGEKIIVNFY